MKHDITNKLHFSFDERWGIPFVFVGTDEEMTTSLRETEVGCGWEPNSTAGMEITSVTPEEVTSGNVEEVAAAIQYAIRNGWYESPDLCPWTLAVQQLG